MTSCDEVWNWNGCDSKMVDTVFGDPGGAVVFGDPSGPGHCYWIQPVGRIKMYPARLQVDLSTLKGLDTIEVDVNELDYAGRTKVFAYAYGQSSAFVQAASSAAGTQTIQIDVSGDRPVTLAVACAECEVSEVRLISAGAIVPLDAESFSTVKGMFRAR